jgi:hypothetical protein
MWAIQIWPVILRGFMPWGAEGVGAEMIALAVDQCGSKPRSILIFY